MNATIGLSHLALKTSLTPRPRDYVSKVHNGGTACEPQGEGPLLLLQP